MIRKDVLLELQNFMKDYERNANKRNFDLIKPLISENAVYWFSDGSFVGLKEIEQAFINTWNNLPDEKYLMSDLKWLQVSSSSAVCIYKFLSEYSKNGKRESVKGRATNVFIKDKGLWHIILELLRRNPKMES